MICFLIIVILYCSDIYFNPNFWNHVGRESNVPPAGFTHICRRVFSLGAAMPKRSDAAGVSSACFYYRYVLRGASIPAWSGKSLDRSSAMPGAGDVG